MCDGWCTIAYGRFDKERGDLLRALDYSETVTGEEKRVVIMRRVQTRKNTYREVELFSCTV